jgi:hypothetical protein
LVYVSRQPLDDLLDEERVAAGALADSGLQNHKRRIGAQEVVQELRNRFGTEGKQRKLLLV